MVVVVVVVVMVVMMMMTIVMIMMRQVKLRLKDRRWRRRSALNHAATASCTHVSAALEPEHLAQAFAIHICMLMIHHPITPDLTRSQINDGTGLLRMLYMGQLNQHRIAIVTQSNRIRIAIE